MKSLCNEIVCKAFTRKITCQSLKIRCVPSPARVMSFIRYTSSIEQLVCRLFAGTGSVDCLMLQKKHLIRVSISPDEDLVFC